MKPPTRPEPFRASTRNFTLLAILALSLMLAGIAGPALGAEEVDTFYLRLYQDGAELAAAGNYVQAVDKLRLACFGMLEKPPVLAACLGRLLVTQDAAGVPDDEIEATVDRLLEVEKRFRGWSEPDPRFAPSAELRRRVESLFVRFGTAESLGRIPGLGDAALEKQAKRIAEMPLEERRRELNLLVQRQAQVSIWHVMSAELSLEEGDPRAAAGAASEILRKFEGNAAARCVLGRARAAQEQCSEATLDQLRMCPGDHAQRVEIDRALVVCLVAGERWVDADAAWRRLPPSVQEQRAVRRLRKQIEKGLESQPTGGAAGIVGEPVAEKESPTPRAASRAPVYAPPPGIVEEDLMAETTSAQPTPTRPTPTQPTPTQPTPIQPTPIQPTPIQPTAANPATRTGANEPMADEASAAQDRFGDLPDEAQGTLRRVRDALASEQRQLYADLWTPVRKVAKRHDESAVAQRLAGSLAFRLGKWRDAVRFLRRDESLLANRPQLQLELAVALHYQGERDKARSEFARCRPHLATTAWVEYWAAELGA